jgi:PAS domain S-box-containing protein
MVAPNRSFVNWIGFLLLGSGTLVAAFAITQALFSTNEHAVQALHRLATMVSANVPVTAAAGGVLMAMLGLLISVQSRQRRKAEALATCMAEDLDRIAAVVRQTSQAVIMMDRHSVITWVNESFSRLYGYTREEAVGKTMGHLVGSPRTAPETIQALADAAAAGRTCRVEVINRAKDGRDHWIETEVQPTFDASGQITGFIELAQNITVLKEALMAQEAALRDTQTLLTTINTHMIVSVSNAQGVLIDVNEAFCQASGYTRSELIGQHYRLINSGHHSPVYWALMWYGINLGQPWRSEICNKAKSGQLYWVDNVIAPFRGADGRIEKFISIATESTLRKQVEQQLRASQALLDRAGRVAGIGGWQYDMATQRLTLSDQTRRIYDMASETAPRPLELLSRLADEGKQLISEAARQVLSDGKPFDLELQARAATGRDIWARLIGEPEFEGGKLARIVGAVQEVTAQRKANDALNRTSDLLRNVLDSASEVAIMGTNEQLEMTVFNRGAERLLGYRADEMIGKLTPAVFHDDMEVKLRAKALSEQTGNEVVGGQLFVHPEILGKSLDWTYVRKDKSRVRVSLVITQQRNAQGEVVGYLGVAHDLTDRQRYESSLRHAMMQAEQANRTKSQFLATMSHEIRTPMNAILGMLKLLGKTPLSARQLDYTSKTEGAARSLLALLNDILDFSKAEAGQMLLDPREFHLETLLRDMAVILSSNVGIKPIEILFDVDPAVPPCLIGDDLRLRQILINLGGNAIKFTHEGEVVLGIRMLATGQGQTTLRVSVSDTGVGIAPAALTQIFESFQQAESNTTRQFGGTGLGLTISKRLVELMGGQLSVNSQLGMGSEFWFDVTLGVSQTSHAISQTESKPLRVLIVDDHASARRILQGQAHSLGWKADVAEDGQQALVLIQAALSGEQRYAAVFMDWGMPGMNGWETSARIRQLTSREEAPLIVMVTAHDREELAKRSAQEQQLLNAYLVKPVTAQMLLASLSNDTDHRTERAANAQPSTRSLEGLRILLAEDNPNNQQVAYELLVDEGAKVDVAANGHECVQALIRQDGAYDIVLMDIQMPVMDGLSASRRIRELIGDRAPPIVAMTANAQEADRAASLEAGMVDHVGKPFDLDDLVDTIRTHTRREQRLRVSAPQVAVPQLAQELAHRHGVRLHEAIARLGGRQDVYRKMLQSFSHDIGGASSRVNELWQAGQIKGLSEWLHTIKGLSATLGFQSLAETAAQAERLITQAPTGDALPMCLVNMDLAIQATNSALNELMEALESHGESPTDGLVKARVDTPKLVVMLRALQARLERSDMQALDIRDEIVKLFGPAQSSHLQALNEAMSALDFPKAREQVLALIKQYKTE